MSEKTTMSGEFISQFSQEMTKNILTSSDLMNHNNLIWKDKKGEINRHCTTLNIDNLPEEIQEQHQFMFRYLTFFQKYIKPVVAEFVATWMLVFWACMLQPGVSDLP